MSENEFIIDTTLDTKDVEVGAERLNKRMQKLSKQIDKMSDEQKLALQKSADSYNKTSRAVESQKDKIQQLVVEMEKMKETQVPTQEYVDIQKQIDSAKEKLGNLTEQQDLFISNGGKTKSQTYKQRKQEIEQLQKTIKYAKAEQQDLIDNGGAYTTADTSNIEKQIEDAKVKLNDLENDLSNKGLNLKIKLDALDNRSLILKVLTAEFKGILALAKVTSKGIKGTFSLAFNGIKKISSITFNAIKSGISKVFNAFKNPKTLSKPFDMGFKKIMKYGLGVRSVFALINKLRNSLMDGVKNLANFNNGSNKVNQDMTLLKSSMTQLKNSFSTAFAPIISAVVPVLTKLSAMISEIVTKIGMLIAKLGGASTFIKAKKVVDNYADSVGNANKQLGAFDELNNISGDSGNGGLSANDMFEEVPIDESASDLADKFKQSWEDADFEFFGAEIGQKILDSLKKIPWGEIQSLASKVGKSLATLLNGIFKTDGLGFELGNTIAQGINTALIFVHDFLANFDFSAFGKFIGDGINGLLLNIDWDTMGENFALKWNGIFETIKNANETIDWTGIAKKIASGINTAIKNINASEIGKTVGSVVKNAFGGMSKFIQEVHWYELGTKVKECICAVDWNGVADALFETIGSAIGGLASFLWGIIEDAMNDLKDWWYDNAFENGSFSITGLLDGIVEALVNIGTWIHDHIFAPFKEGFCNAFQIHSPSKFMSEMGEFLVQGLFDGIDGMIDDVVQLWEDFKETVLGVFDALWEGLKGIINSILGGIESMANGVVNGINKVIDVLNNLHVEIPDWVPKFGGKSIGFNLGHISEISIPKLANGTVVPRQASEFMAIMGDNNKETEVVSPLSTMVDAFNQANNNSESIQVLKEILQVLIEKETGITDSQLFDSVQRSARNYTRATGKLAF